MHVDTLSLSQPDELYRRALARLIQYPRTVGNGTKGWDQFNGSGEIYPRGQL